LLFGATSGATGDPRKGLPLLQTALKCFAQSHPTESLELVIFGADAPSSPPDFGFKAHYLGQLHDDVTLALAYSAADGMVVPSVQEAFGQTASEALACGTPVIAFKATGLKDIVEHQQQGYLATPFDPEDLARGIDWVLSERDRHRQLRHQARQRAITEFNQQLQAQRYLSLFTELIHRIPSGHPSPS
jgi:glycosyltransferase involved in cell wall biosynthesis